MTTEIMNTDEVRALANFIFNVYPQREYKFATSLTTYSIVTTDEEQLLNEVFYAREKIKNPSFDRDKDPLFTDYMSELPSLVTAIIVAHATSAKDADNAITFVQDAMNDLMRCYLAEEDLNFDLYEDA